MWKILFACCSYQSLSDLVISIVIKMLSQVNFMVTDTTVTNRRRRRDTVHQHQRAISESDAQLYRDLAQASGGQAIEVTKSELSVATSIITESSSSSLVRAQMSLPVLSYIISKMPAVSSVSCDSIGDAAAGRPEPREGR